jgi:hypothetical protein
VCERTTEARLCPEHQTPTVVPALWAASTHRVPGVGERIAERYELRAVLGEGGMAVVFRARDLRTHQDVALKFMRPPQRLLLRHVKRFWREARALSEVRHPNVIELIDFGVDEASGLPFMAMALVEGQALSERVLRAPLDERSAAKLLSAVARALEAAHTRGFAHRDLKPDNVMLGADGRVVVLDFGVALALSDTDERITAPGAVVGTPHYMSPEQARGGGVDARSDLYGLGCILYATLTGAPPFDSDDPRRVMDLHLAMPPPPLPTRLVDGAPPTVALLSLAAALLAKDPEARPASAGAVGEVLEALARGEPSAALRRLSEATAGVMARANARAAIAALPTGHAVPLEALVRPTPSDGRVGPDVGRGPGTPLGRLPAADTAVAPREQDAPLDEPSVMRTAPTAWALERPGRDEPDTPVDPVTHVALEHHAASGATRAALRSAVEARVVVGHTPSVDEPPRTEVQTEVQKGATAPDVLATRLRATNVAEPRLVAEAVELATRPSAGAVTVGVSRAYVAAAALAMLVVGIGVGWSMRTVGAPEHERAYDPPLPSPRATVSAPATASGPAVVVSTSASGSLAGSTAAPVPVSVPAPVPVSVPSVSPSPSSTPVSPPARPGGQRPRVSERPSPVPSAPSTLGSRVVSVRLSSTPAGARVLRGVTTLGVTPLDVRVEGEVSLRVVLDGYAERTVVLRAGDGERAVTLVPLF